VTAGAKPYTMKVVRTVFNGGHEETYGYATRLVPTQSHLVIAISSEGTAFHTYRTGRLEKKRGSALRYNIGRAGLGKQGI
jgi:hypothetical protein